MSATTLLAEGTDQLGLSLTATMQAQMLDYLALLQKWNKVYNLTAITELEQMVTKHLLDSLSILPYLQGQRFLDVGTGAGLPGIPLALAQPEREFVLLDSNSKKTRFLQHAKQQLGLSNITIVHQRIEDYSPQPLFCGIISRAFSSLANFVAGSHHCLRADGVFWAMKGQFAELELQALPSAYKLYQCYVLDIPNLAEQRHLLGIMLDS